MNNCNVLNLDFSSGLWDLLLGQTFGLSVLSLHVVYSDSFTFLFVKVKQITILFVSPVFLNYCLVQHFSLDTPQPAISAS